MDAYSNGNSETIFDIAATTDDTLQECLTILRKSSHSLRDVLEDHERRFVAWWQYLGVFALPRTNLDARLQHNPEVKDMVVSFLVILNRNFQLLLQCLSKDLSIPQSPLGSQNTSLAINSIDQSLTQLSHLGYSIRNSSRTTETTRARRFVALHHDLSSFTNAAAQAITILYPNAPESLQSQLSRSMGDRYARILYRTHRQESLAFDYRLETSTAIGNSLGKQPITDVSVVQPEASDRTIMVPRAPPTLGLTSLHPSEFRKRLRNPMAPKSYSGATTALLQDCREPQIPSANTDDDRTCHWCSRILEPRDVENNAWTQHGREHYRCDLEPYTCLSEKCLESTPSFSSVRKWRRHMRSHGIRWTNDVHNPPMWSCPVDHDQPEATTANAAHETEARFSTAYNLRTHLKSSHHAFVSMMTDAELSDIVEKQKVHYSRPTHQCMLCQFTIEHNTTSAASTEGTKRHQVDDHSAQVKRVKPFRSAGMNNSSAAEKAVSADHKNSPMPRSPLDDNDDGAPHEKMEHHILQHLNFVMLVSLQLIDNKTGEPRNICEDDSGQRGASVEHSTSSRLLDGDALSSFHSQGSLSPADSDNPSFRREEPGQSRQRSEDNETMMRNHQAPRKVQQTPELDRLDANHLRTIGYEEHQLFSSVHMPDIPMTAQEHKEVGAKLQIVSLDMGKRGKTLLRWYGLTRDDARARDFFKQRNRLLRQFKDDKMTQLRETFSINSQEIDNMRVMLQNMAKDLAATYPQAVRENKVIEQEPGEPAAKGSAGSEAGVTAPPAVAEDPLNAKASTSVERLPTAKDHTTSELSPDGDEYIPRHIDQHGEQKVDVHGALLGGREYRMRIFHVPHRGSKLFMLGTECARVLGYRDSYLLFNKNRTLKKIIASQVEKDDLVNQEIIPFSYRSRQFAIVTARSMFRQFGSRVIVQGRRVRDDYWETQARSEGFTELDRADSKMPGQGRDHPFLQSAPTYNSQHASVTGPIPDSRLPPLHPVFRAYDSQQGAYTTSDGLRNMYQYPAGPSGESNSFLDYSQSYQQSFAAPQNSSHGPPRNTDASESVPSHTKDTKVDDIIYNPPSIPKSSGRSAKGQF